MEKKTAYKMVDDLITAVMQFEACEPRSKSRKRKSEDAARLANALVECLIKRPMQEST